MDPKNIVALNNIEILGKKKDDSSQKIEKPAPSHDSGTIPRADPRNPYNDPTLPYYNPDLGKKKDDEHIAVQT